MTGNTKKQSAVILLVAAVVIVAIAVFNPHKSNVKATAYPTVDQDFNALCIDNSVNCAINN